MSNSHDCLVDASSGGGSSSSEAPPQQPQHHECCALGGQSHQPLAGVTNRAPIKRVAACITGQLRGFPVAFVSWNRTILRLLRAGGEFELDLFLVVANSTSLLHWRPIIDRLDVARLVVTEPTAYYNKTARATDGWAVRRQDGVVHFNLGRFPWFTEHKYGVVLMQQHQLGVCRGAIREHEKLSGFRYRRVARLRTDVVFSGVLVEGWVAKLKGGPVPRASWFMKVASALPDDRPHLPPWTV